jgi:hypothetical protein
MFNYSSPGVLHLIVLINNAATLDLLPYIKERACDPIGMANVAWGKTGARDSSVPTVHRQRPLLWARSRSTLGLAVDS